MSRNLEDVIGFHFRRPELLAVALTHKSFASEQRTRHDNERLEFLGDSILSAVVAHRLYEGFPDEDEGSLSKRKSGLVSRASLADCAREMGLGGHLRLGAGEESSGGRLRPSILCNALEALIGAVYLDGGYDAAGDFVRRWLLRRDGVVEETDYKSRLQEIIQRRHKVPPHYEIVRATGPEHDKTFGVTVRLGKNILGAGAGKSKKEAEQSAAKDALRKLSAQD